MATESVGDAVDDSMPNGIAAVCLLHLGLGAMAVLAGLAVVVLPIGFGTSFLGGFAVVVGLVLLTLGYGLMEFRERAWRRTILFHGVDTAVGVALVFTGGIEHLIGIVVSVGVIVYLSSQRDRYLGSE